MVVEVLEKISKLNLKLMVQPSFILCTCMTKWTAYNATKLSGSVHTQLSNAHKQQIADNRNYIKTITDIILELGMSGSSI